MIYSIQGELLTDKFETGLSITIVRGNNLHLFTSIPTKSGNKIVFNKSEMVSISYYFGEFHYQFKVEFNEEIKEEGLYNFIINEVEIEKNYRKEKRELTEVNALIMDSKNMYYSVILDMSGTGMKIETNNPILKSKIEIHYINNEGKSTKEKGKIVWSKKGKNDKYYYGIKLK